jgi:large subunit ribosomal protein L25
MEVGKLNVTLRDRIGKGGSRALRRQGLVPGTCYGAGLDQPLNIIVNPKALKDALDPIKGRNTVIDLTLQDKGAARGKQIKAMLWEWQVDPVKRNVIHVDLIAIDPNREVQVEVPLEVSGKAAGTVDGGQIHIIRHTIPVKCKPVDIPVKFVLDITPLHIGDALHASDLVIPPGVIMVIPGDVGLVTCAAPPVEKEPTPEEAAAAAAAAGEPGAEGAAPPAEGAAPAEGGDKKDAKAAEAAAPGKAGKGKDKGG